jgi:hypothetical protein
MCGTPPVAFHFLFLFFYFLGIDLTIIIPLSFVWSGRPENIEKGKRNHFLVFHRQTLTLISWR